MTDRFPLKGLKPSRTIGCFHIYVVLNAIYPLLSMLLHGAIRMSDKTARLHSSRTPSYTPKEDNVQNPTVLHRNVYPLTHSSQLKLCKVFLKILYLFDQAVNIVVHFTV